MSYGTRLLQAIQDAGVTRKELARELGVTVHAIAMVVTSAGNKERWLSRENHLKAAKFLKVDANWLMTGENAPEKAPLYMQESPPELSPTAMELAWLYDQIPLTERIRRVVAYNAATQQILNVLQELSAEPPTAEPKSAAAGKKRIARGPER